MKYYVLGKKDSPLLTEYLEKYYQKLVSNLHSMQSDIPEIKKLLEIENRDFVLSPDISSLINDIRMNGIGNSSRNIGKLSQEVGYFLSGDQEKLTSNQGSIIGNTNIRLSDQDNNPYNTFEAHPDHKNTGGVLGWGAKSQEDWLNVYSKTFELLQQIDEGMYGELNMIIKKIIPLGTSQGVHNSASYKECIGHLYMGYTIDSEFPEINILEAIIHESSHNKLNLLMQFDPIILNDKSEKYYSPYRPDARHVHGCFLGLHAFVPTMYICLKAYNQGILGGNISWLEKFLTYHLKNKLCLRVIQKHGKLSNIGFEVLDEIIEVIKLTDILFQEISLSKELIQDANQSIKEHFSEVNRNYPQLEY